MRFGVVGIKVWFHLWMTQPYYYVFKYLKILSNRKNKKIAQIKVVLKLFMFTLLNNNEFLRIF